jgi:hypothetical protein
MTLYALVLFFHISGALGLFISLALEWAAVRSLRGSLTLPQVRTWLPLFSYVPRFAGPSFGVILLSGGYLAAKISGGREGWIQAALLGLFLIATINMSFSVPRIKAIRKANLNASDRQIPDVLRVRLEDPFLLAALRMRIALGLGIVFLMVSKLPLDASLMTMAAAACAGGLSALPLWRQSQKPQPNA